MTTNDPTYDNDTSGRTVAAVFADRDNAKSAIDDLHDAGFRNCWLGVTRGDPATGETTVESGGSGVMGSIGRFFSGEGTHGKALHEVLTAHGLTADQARRIEGSVVPNSAIVTVDGENDPAEATDILEECGGSVQPMPGADYDSGYASRGIGDEPSIANAGVSGTAAGRDLTAPRARADVDDARRMQLREERLNIDKERVQSGEARIGKNVVSERQSVDVPVYHEELFIERRPVSGAAAATGSIGDGEDIRVPLTEERVNVGKTTVVTEDVAVGKRRVEGTEHVADTVRREELNVDDAATTNATSSDPYATPRDR